MNKIPNSFARFPEETIGQHSDKCLCISFLEGKPKKVFFKRSLRRCLQLLGMGKACQALLKPHKIWNLHADRQPTNRKRYVCYWITHVTIVHSIHPSTAKRQNGREMVCLTHNKWVGKAWEKSKTVEKSCKFWKCVKRQKARWALGGKPHKMRAWAGSCCAVSGELSRGEEWDD